MKKPTLLSMCLLFAGVLWAQNMQITGVVTDASDGLPLQGATVIIKGTNTVVIADVNGRYSITAPSNGTLMVSFMGMLPAEININGRSVIHVSLEPDAQQLGEIVVTALGISREKKALGYAMQEVKGEEMTKARQSNAIGLLSGKVAGLQVISVGGAIGGSSRVVMRGIKSVLGNNQPLYVIDGIPIDNSDLTSTASAGGAGGGAGVSKDFGNMAQDINPDDIESISVLKGASASALYGSRANNGVILITTKKGSKNQGFDVSFTTGFSMENMLSRNMPVVQKLYGGGGGNRTNFNVVTIDGRQYNVPSYDIDESWGPRLDGTPALQWNNLYPEEPGYLKETPWVYPKYDVMHFFRTGLVFDNNVSVSGSGERTAFRVSYTNKTASGIIPNSSLSRNTLSAIGSVNYNKITISSSLNYVHNYVKGRPWTGTTNRNVINQHYQWGMVQVDYKQMENYQRADGSQRLWNVSAWNNLTPRYIDNPYWAAHMSYSEEQRDRTYGNMSVNYEIFDWLNASAKVTGDTYTYGIEDRIAVYSRSTSEYSEAITRFREMNYEAMLSANHKFGDFSLNAFVGGNIMSQRRHTNSAVTEGGLIVPLYYNLMNATAVSMVDRTYRRQINSVFGSASLGWKGFLFLDGTFRNDWSSTLPADNNSYFYPSVTGSFVFSDTPLLHDTKWLTFGKLRLGWAQVGNDTDPYVLEKDYQVSQGAFGGVVNYQLPTSLNNSGLKPESTRSWEIGLDLRALDSRIGLDLTFYDNLTKNQCMAVDVPTSSGYRQVWRNAGSIINRGVEISLTGTPVRTKNLEWTMMVNWAKNKNEVKELYGDLNSLRIASSLVSLYAVVGQPYGMISGADYVYDNEGNKVVNANGVYERTEQAEFLGSVLPDWIMGIRSDLRYKNFTFGFLFDIRKGGKFYSQTYRYGMYSGILEETAANGVRENGIVLDGVRGNVSFRPDGSYTVTNTSPNTMNIDAWTWCRSIANGPLAQNIFDSDFVKLRELSFGYTFNTSHWSHVRSLNLSAFAYNVWTLYKANKHIDPDFTSGSGNIQGVEGAIVPAPITYGMSVNIKF